jgi:uracil-DNA glycosylase
VTAYATAIAGFASEQNEGWATLPFFTGGAAQLVGHAVDHLAASNDVLPSPSDLLSALHLTPLPDVRVVILGQDPYPTPGDAHGLAFSVQPGQPIPRSLSNIFKELNSDLGLARPSSGSLIRWAEQGVLLLNTCLTVTAGQAGSHRKLGWQELTDQMIAAVSARATPAVFILWGADAQQKQPMIDAKRHLVITTAHPSPLSARRGFFGSRPFSRANTFLKEKGQPEIDWRL